jgi:hypothetical protein
MSVERALAAVIFLVSILLLVRLGPMAVRSWQIYSGTGKRRQVDATARAIPLPPNVADRIALLGGLGYRRVGETSLVLPVGERFAWIVAAEDGESYAILATGLTGIYSAWPDGMWLSTLHPLGPVVDRPNLQARVIPTTLEAAVVSHREALQRLRQVHGAPRPVRAMADMLALDADYRVRFGGSVVGRQTARNIAPAACVAVIATLALALLVLSR